MLRQNAKHTLSFMHIHINQKASLCYGAGSGSSPAGLAADDRGQRIPDGHRDAAPLHHPLLAALALRPEAPRRGLFRVVVDAAGRERAPVVATGSPALHGEHGRHGGRRVGTGGRPGGGGPGRARRRRRPAAAAAGPPPEEGDPGEDGAEEAAAGPAGPRAAAGAAPASRGVVGRRRGERRERGRGG